MRPHIKQGKRNGIGIESLKEWNVQNYLEAVMFPHWLYLAVETGKYVSCKEYLLLRLIGTVRPHYFEHICLCLLKYNGPKCDQPVMECRGKRVNQNVKIWI